MKYSISVITICFSLTLLAVTGLFWTALQNAVNPSAEKTAFKEISSPEAPHDFHAEGLLTGASTSSSDSFSVNSADGTSAESANPYVARTAQKEVPAQESNAHSQAAESTVLPFETFGFSTPFAQSVSTSLNADTQTEYVALKPLMQASVPAETSAAVPTAGTSASSNALPAESVPGSVPAAIAPHFAAKASSADSPASSTPKAGTKNPDADRPSRYGMDLTKPFDPVKENGEIFVGWKKPEITLVLTGRLNGYMEPCGCAGMERMTGGLSRQSSFFQQLKEKGWNPLILDVGGISPGVTKQAQMKFLATVNMLREMEYDAITLGSIDLTFPCADILAEVANPGHQGQLFTSANVGLFDFDDKVLPPAKIMSRNGFKIGIVGILGEEARGKVQNDEVVYRSPRIVLAKLIPQLKKQCQFIILLSHASQEESRALAKEFPDLDIIVTPDGPPVSPSVPEVIPGTGQYFITIGEKGMNVLVLGLYNDDQQPLRYQRVPMDSRFPSSQKILDLMALYQNQLKLEGLEGLGIRPLNNPFLESNGLYVGSKRCESCHNESYKKWKKSRHAIAWKSLETSNPPRTFDPECIACHVVGWNAEHRMPFQSGFMNMQETKNLSHVGCESCHGPGSFHMNAEIGTDTVKQEKFRKAMRLEKKDAKAVCIQCHDLDNSPNFNFERYYKCIEHHEESDEDEDEDMDLDE